MFTLPFVHTLHHALTSHAFGRGHSQQPSVAAAPSTPALVMGAADVALPGARTDSSADDIPDLAQRVREVGEW